MTSTPRLPTIDTTVNRSRLALAFLAVLLGIGLWYPPAPPPNPKSVPGGDIVLFRAVVDRMRGGEPYYPTMRDELRKRGYPTASIFNWRPPGTFVLLSRTPRLVHAIMLVLGIAAVFLTGLVFRDKPAFARALAIFLALGAAALPFLPITGLYLPELWAGLLLLLSVLGYSLGAVRLAVCCAIAAVCARELAMAYVLVCIAFAVHERRMQEVRWYAAGLTIFAAYYVAHIAVARMNIQPGDMAHSRSWIAFGGWPFVVSLTALGGWHILLPRWTGAIGAVLVAASLWSRADPHFKIMAATYLALFCVLGQPFNNSWGLLLGPAWGLASAYGVVAVQQLLRSAMLEAAPAKPIPYNRGT
jgi:hypothetical protein